MKLSTNQRILLSITTLIIFYCITGYISIDNLIESRNKTTRNSQIIQPSIILLSELELMILTSKNYSATWLNIDLTEHPDKRKLSEIHSKIYPKWIKKMKSIATKWEDERNRMALIQIIGVCDTIILGQKEIMNSLTTIKDYQDFLLRVKVENKFDEVNIRANLASDQIHSLLSRLKLQSEEEETIVLKTFSSIKTTNILLTILAVLISMIVTFAVHKLLKVEGQRNQLAKEHAISQLQKTILADKNKEITDSILYAKRLQQSILPSLSLIKKHFPRNFIYYRPKDIVSGDFYWLKEISENEILIAAADCTGHGVPGACVSFVCNSGLNGVVADSDTTNPGQILDLTSEYVQSAFSQYGEFDVKDGMDIALCSFVKNTGGAELRYSGANNSICVIKRKELIVLEAARQPIGSGRAKGNFFTHTLNLEKGDMVYLFTDGFIDQFGGAKNKKYKSKNFYAFLQNISQKSIAQQEELIAKEYTDWTGTNFQVDDVLIIGVQIT